MEIEKKMLKLRQYDTLIRMIEDEIRESDESIACIGSCSNNSPVQNSVQSNKPLDLSMRIIELENKLSQMKEDRNCLKKEMIGIVKMLDMESQDILIMYYIKCYSIRKIASITSFSMSKILRRKTNALKKAQKFYEENKIEASDNDDFLKDIIEYSQKKY